MVFQNRPTQDCRATIRDPTMETSRYNLKIAHASTDNIATNPFVCPVRAIRFVLHECSRNATTQYNVQYRHKLEITREANVRFD